MNIEQLQMINRNDTVNILLRFLSRSNPVSDNTNLESFKNFLTSKGFFIVVSDFYNFFKELSDIKLDGKPIGYLRGSNMFKWNFSFKDISEQILSPNKIVKIESFDKSVGEESFSLPDSVTQQQTEMFPETKEVKNTVVGTITEHPAQIEMVKKNKEKVEMKEKPVMNKRRGRPPGSPNKRKLPTIITTDERPPAVATQQPARKRGRPAGYRKPMPAPTGLRTAPMSKEKLVFGFMTKRGKLVLLDLEDAEKLAKEVELIKSEYSA